MTYEADDEEADRIYEEVDKNMDARRRVRRCVRWLVALAFVLDSLMHFDVSQREARS